MTKTRFKFRRSPKNGQYYWHAIRSGRIVADSGEGYTRLAAAKRSLVNLISSLACGDYEVVDTNQGKANRPPRNP